MAELPKDDAGRRFVGRIDSEGNIYMPSRLEDKEGNPNNRDHPLYSKDEDVKEELEAVKAELEAIKNGTLKTELTRSDIERTIDYLPEEVRIEDTGVGEGVFQPPHWAKGVMVTLIIGGVTGSFEDGEGVKMRVYNGYNFPSANTNLRVVDTTTEAITRPVRSTTVVIYPGELNVDDVYRREENNAFYHYKLPLAETFFPRILISGTFEEGEGFQSSMKVTWI